LTLLPTIALPHLIHRGFGSGVGDDAFIIVDTVRPLASIHAQDIEKPTMTTFVEAGAGVGWVGNGQQPVSRFKYGAFQSLPDLFRYTCGFLYDDENKIPMESMQSGSRNISYIGVSGNPEHVPVGRLRVLDLGLKKLARDSAIGSIEKAPEMPPQHCSNQVPRGGNRNHPTASLLSNIRAEHPKGLVVPHSDTTSDEGLPCPSTRSNCCILILYNRLNNPLLIRAQPSLVPQLQSLRSWPPLQDFPKERVRVFHRASV
jgi:hypothetical protein